MKKVKLVKLDVESYAVIIVESGSVILIVENDIFIVDIDVHNLAITIFH